MVAQGRQAASRLQRAPRGGVVGRVHLGVNVRSQNESLAPVADGAVRIELLGSPEGAGGPSVVEAVGQDKSLVKIPLGLWDRGRNRHGMRAESVQEGRPGGVIDRFCGLTPCEEKGCQEKKRE